jgi:hypothetical protein
LLPTFRERFKFFTYSSRCLCKQNKKTNKCIKYEKKVQTVMQPISTNVLFTMFVFVCAVQHILYCVFILFSFVLFPYVASFSGLSIFDCPFSIL